jgi:hypothetical protein
MNDSANEIQQGPKIQKKDVREAFYFTRGSTRESGLERKLLTMLRAQTWPLGQLPFLTGTKFFILVHKVK